MIHSQSSSDDLPPVSPANKLQQPSKATSIKLSLNAINFHEASGRESGGRLQGSREAEKQGRRATGATGGVIEQERRQTRRDTTAGEMKFYE